MTILDYQKMSDQDLRKYFLKNKEDKLALQEYFSRKRDENKPIITTMEDPDFDDKIRNSIQAQINQHDNKLDK